MGQVWGWHLLVDCSGMDSDLINSPDIIRAFVGQLVEDIDMVPIGDTQIMWCDTHEDEKKGYTFIQIIETSNIIGHLCSYDNTGFIDVWSCKPYDQAIAIELVKKYFKPTAIRTQFVERIAP
jgi:S-adenosylmethionine/arginine decarboxylase-like enzyme